MAHRFSQATAEQVLSAVDAVVANGKTTKADFVEAFADLPSVQAAAALELADDLGFLCREGDGYRSASPLCRFVVASNEMQRAAVLRIVLEAYDPFVIFRSRLAVGSPSNAAQQTKVLLDLDAHREAIKDTLISLGTFSHALITEGGGRYTPDAQHGSSKFEALATACQEAAAAEAHVTELLAEVLDDVPRDHVIVPLANALKRAGQGDPRGSVVEAGNAVETFLDVLAAKFEGVNLVGATGINAKLDRLSNAGLPKKLTQAGKYLGTVRNAADHGADPDTGVPWEIQENTSLAYVFSACSFIIGTLKSIAGSFKI